MLNFDEELEKLSEHYIVLNDFFLFLPIRINFFEVSKSCSQN